MQVNDLEAVKVYFYQIAKTDKLIKRLCDTVDALRADLTSISCELKPDKVQTSSDKDNIANAIAKIVDLEDKINACVDELIDLKSDMFVRVKKLTDFDQRNILIARYIEGARWEKIACDFNLSLRQVHRIHNAALLSFAAKNPDILKSRHTMSHQPVV